MNTSLSKYFENLYLNPPTELINSFNSQKGTKLYYENVFPCFFTGNLDLKNPLVSISLNPKYDDNKPNEQGDNFINWLDGCMNGFILYQNDKSLHSIWKYLVKVFFSEEQRKTGIKELLQDNVVNIDWCYYYSWNFPTINLEDLMNSKKNKIYKLFDDNLRKLISDIQPKVIFIHGKSLENWFNYNCDNICHEVTLKHGNKSYKIFSGLLQGMSVPVIYQEWFINRGNKIENLDIVRSIIDGKKIA
jgi:hypothetical protein